MNENTISNAIEALKKGEIIVYPTDTLYALGADVYNKNAVKMVFNLKKRSFDQPFSIAVFNFEEINKICVTNENVKRIVKKFLPGPLTLLLNKKKLAKNIFTGESEKIAVRIPNNKIALSLLSKFGPLTATSANIHSKKPSNVINEIFMQFHDNVSVYLDDGMLDNPASTIVDLTIKVPVVVRQGSIKIEEIINVIKNE